MFKVIRTFYLILVIVAASMTGCEAEPLPKVPVQDPITIHIGGLGGFWFSDEWFNKHIKEPVSKMDPNISVEIKRSLDLTPESIRGGSLPDILYIKDSRLTIPPQILMDLRQLASINKLELSGIIPSLLRQIENYGDNGQLIGVPFEMEAKALCYNKQIFDTLKVEYPRDGMTMEELLHLAKRLTVSSGGKQYIGMYPLELETMIKAIALPVYEGDKPYVLKQSEEWKRLLDTYAEMKGLFKGIPESYYMNTSGADIIAMFEPAVISDCFSGNRDAVAIPAFDGIDHPAFNGVLSYLAVSKSSKHPEEAVKVISYLISKEHQTAMSRRGGVPVLHNSEVQKQFMADMSDSIKGKNIAALFAYADKGVVKDSPYEGTGYSILESMIKAADFTIPDQEEFLKRFSLDLEHSLDREMELFSRMGEAAKESALIKAK